MSEMKTINDIRAVVYERGDRENEIVRRFLSRVGIIAREYDDAAGPGA